MFNNKNGDTLIKDGVPKDYKVADKWSSNKHMLLEMMLLLFILRANLNLLF